MTALPAALAPSAPESAPGRRAAPRRSHALHAAGLTIAALTGAAWLADRAPPGGFAPWTVTACAALAAAPFVRPRRPEPHHDSPPTPQVPAPTVLAAPTPPPAPAPAPPPPAPLEHGERAALEGQLRQAQKMEAVGRLAGGVAHDLNNLLTVINGYSDMLVMALPDGGPAREMVQEIRKSGERAAGLTRQLLAFSRKQVLKPRLLDLTALVLDLSKMLRRLIGEDVHLNVVGHGVPLPVLIDRGQMEQVLMNLAVNARDAMPRGGRLTIQTETVDARALPADCESASAPAPGPYALLTVSDTGCGMDEATKARLFEPFFTTKEVGKGTGLGLATVYGIVKQSGGRIEVRSEPGRGTTFRIFLPLSRELSRAADDSQFPAPRPPAQGTETLLLVEDEEAVRDVAQRTLEFSGYRVLPAANGLEGLARFREHEGAIDLVITDVVMPHLGGPELVARLEQMNPQIKVIFMSGYTGSVLLRQGVVEGRVTYLDKPFTADSLTRLVRAVLDGRLDEAA